MWLPLALADLKASILAPWMKREDAERLLATSKTLAGWCLPIMSRAVAADEKERAALDLFNSVKNLAARQNRQ